MIRVLNYQGITRLGTAVSGSIGSTVTPGEFTRDRFERRWCVLTVRENGQLVGVIGPHPDTHRRTWWAEP